MAYKYEDFEQQARAAGLLEQFSQYDLDTARRFPEFGLSMLSYKQDYANAADQAGRDAANNAAENLRRQYGSYMGGSDGSQYYGLGPSPGSYQSQYQSGINDILGKMQGYGDFTYGEAPTYTSRYQSELDSLLDEVLNFKDFTWSKETDPAYAAYAKQYRREGDRATQNALARAAAMSGGQLSSAAMTAASQAGDYYAGQLSDAIPELVNAAYSRYLGEYDMLTDQLGQTRQAEQMDYNQYLNELSQYNTDRAQAYDEYLNGYNMLGSNLNALQGQDELEYGRLLDQIGFNSDQQALAQGQIDAMLAAGVMPGADLIGRSGYDSEYIQAMDGYYKQQAAKGSGGGTETEDPKIGDSPSYSDVVRTAKSYKSVEEAEKYLNRMVDNGEITPEEAAYIYEVVLGIEAKTYSGMRYWAEDISDYMRPNRTGRIVESN